MSNILFPHLYGLDWKMKGGLVSSTLIQKATSPRHETRISLDPDPIHKFGLSYVVLDDNSAHDSLNTLQAFWRDRKGDFDSFLLKLDDVIGASRAAVTGQVLAPDVSGYAPFVRPLGNTNSTETVFELAGVNGNPGSAPVVKLNGTPLTPTTDYTISGPGVAVGNTTYPGMVAHITASLGSPAGVVTADFTWYYRVRFELSEQDFDLFFYLLWEAKEVDLIEVGA